MTHETVVLDLDTQFDLVMPEGGWPVPGAYGLLPNLERLTRYARMYSLRVIATAQALTPGDSRFQANGGVEPPHCIQGTPGQAKIFATRPAQPLVVQNRIYPPGELEKLAAGAREIVLETSGPDPMSNPNGAHLLAGVRNAILFGVAADGAILTAARVLLKMGLTVDVVQNAVAARSTEPASLEKAMAEMTTLGARFIRDIDLMTRFTTARHR